MIIYLPGKIDFLSSSIRGFDRQACWELRDNGASRKGNVAIRKLHWQWFPAGNEKAVSTLLFRQ
jgi:hypothetical protein